MRKPLNIAIITNNYTPFSGGVVSSINSFTNELQKQGHTVSIITLDFLGKKHNDPKHVIRIPSIIRFRYKKNHMAIPFRPTTYVAQAIEKINPDIIHTQHPCLLGTSALKAAKKYNIPILFTHHSIYEAYAHYVPLPELIVKPIIKKIVLSFCKKVDGIVAPGSSIKHYLQTNGIKKKIEIIPSGIQPLFFQKKSTNNKTISNTPYHLITVSRMVKEKNIPFLLDMFKKLQGNTKKFRLTLVGYGAAYEQLQTYAYQTQGLNKDEVIFINKPEKQTLLKLYQSANLFLFSSQTETQGLVIAEAMACGCPVVALNGPGQEDIVKNGENGYLVESEGEMIEKIQQIASQENLYQTLSHDAIQTAQKYHPEKTTEQLLIFYKTLIQNAKTI